MAGESHLSVLGLTVDPIMLIGLVVTGSGLWYGMQNQVAALKRRIDAVERRSNGVPEKVAIHDEELKALKADLRRVEDAINGIGAKIDKHADFMMQFRTEIGAVARELHQNQVEQFKTLTGMFVSHVDKGPKTNGGS